MTDISQKQNLDINTISVQFTARLVALNAISTQISNLHDQESILHCAITDGPAIIGADSANIWLWDADQQAPLIHVTKAGSSTEFIIPDTLQHYLNNACAGTIMGITAEHTDTSWPGDMAGHAVAFMPLPDKDGCLGVYTVQRRSGLPFNSEELLLLSSLCNAIASALRNARLFSTERRLLQLLRNSITHVVEATSSSKGDDGEVIKALLQVAEAMTQARATCVALQVDPEQEPLLIVNGPLAVTCEAELRAATLELWQQHGTAIPKSTYCPNIISTKYNFCDTSFWAGSTILLGGKPAGIIIAIRDTPFPDDQSASLHTIADQIGVAIDHRRQTAANNRMLLQLANLNYVSNAITASFDPVKILQEISAAVANALQVPIAFCCELLDDGTLQILPETTAGIDLKVARTLQLTRNNVVIRAVLDNGSGITSRMMGEAASFPTLATLALQDWVCVPMVVTRGGATGDSTPVCGVLLAGDTQPHIFYEREIALISTYANQAALALENSHLYARLDRQLHQMELLYRMTHNISTLDLAVIYEHVTLTTSEALHIPAVVISLTDETSNAQRVVATRGEGLEKYVGAEAADTSLLGLVAKWGQPIPSINIRSDGRSMILRKIARECALSSSISLPLIIGGNTLGTLTALSQETREYSANDQQLLQSIAADAALAVQNARRYQAERDNNQVMHERLAEQNQNHDKEVKWLERLLEIEYEKYAEDGILRRMLTHIRAISAITGDDITDDNKVDIARLMQQRITELRSTSTGLWPIVNINGTHPRLSLIQATALMMLISEYILAMSIAPGKVNTIDITFQQSGNDVLLALKNDLLGTAGFIVINPAIIALVGRELHDLTVKKDEVNGRPVTQIRFSLPVKIEAKNGNPHSYSRR